jgi:dTDP-glucose pyrophosphorylase
MLDYFLIFSSLIKSWDSTYKFASTAALKLIMHIYAIVKTSQPTAAEYVMFNNPTITYLVQSKQGGLQSAVWVTAKLSHYRPEQPLRAPAN